MKSFVFLRTLSFIWIFLMFDFLISKLIFLNTAFKTFQGSWTFSTHGRFFCCFSIKGYGRVRKGKTGNGGEGQQHDGRQWVHVPFGLTSGRVQDRLRKVSWRLCASAAGLHAWRRLPLSLASSVLSQTPWEKETTSSWNLCLPMSTHTCKCVHTCMCARTYRYKYYINK